MAGEPSACRQGESASPNLSTPSERDPYYVFLRKRLIDGSYASGAPCAAAFTESPLRSTTVKKCMREQL